MCLAPGLCPLLLAGLEAHSAVTFPEALTPFCSVYAEIKASFAWAHSKDVCYVPKEDVFKPIMKKNTQIRKQRCRDSTRSGKHPARCSQTRTTISQTGTAIFRGIPCAIKRVLRDFPASTAVKTPFSQCRGPGFDPWSGS